MRSHLKIVTLVAVAMLAVACAKEPVEEMKAVEQDMAAARTEMVRTYAPESLEKAEKKAAAFSQEIATQKSKWAMSRDYDQALEIAADAREAAKAAEADAVNAREALRQEVRAKIVEAREAVDAALAELGTAPVGKGNKAEIEAMKAEIITAEGTFAVMESHMEAEDYKAARSVADEALATATRITDAIRTAREMKAAGRRT
jgi:hypothetical protein